MWCWKGRYICIWLSLVAIAAAASSSISLTKENFDDVTKGKTVFIKFFAPWCGHCQELAPTWEKMAAAFDHRQGLVGEVDCAAEQDFCMEFGVTALPTLLYGETSHGGAFLETYTSSDKTYEALMDFAEENLVKPACSPGNIKGCKDKKVRKQMEAIWKMSPSKLQNAIEEKEGIIQEAEDTFQAEFDKMQAVYDDLSVQHELDVARMKRDIQMLQAVQSSKQ